MVTLLLPAVEATDFEARINVAYSVKVRAIVPDFFGNNNIRITEKTITSNI
jgi:hypothetical protein